MGRLRQGQHQVENGCSYSDDMVEIRRPESASDQSVITINCPDKTGLGSDLCRVLLFFGLNIVKGDVTRVLCELELTIRRVKVSTTPDGKVVDLFFITDTRELLHTRTRKEETYNQLHSVLGDFVICEIEPAGSDMSMCLQPLSSLPPTVIEDMFNLELPEEPQSSSTQKLNANSVTMDNSVSPAHTLIHIFCWDQKGLLFDIMRTLKDYNIQVSYGRFHKNKNGSCELELFIMQADGKKILDPNKQKALCSRLRMELFRPLHVALVNRGPDVELLVTNPVELSGKGRPLVFFDITLALKELRVCIFSAEIARHVLRDREWEVYRILLGDGCEFSSARTAIESCVMKKLMGWH